MLTSEQIRNQAPVGTVSYRLLARLSDGSSRLFPVESAGFFRIGDAPANVPIGKYTVCYYDSANSLIKYADEPVELSQALASPLGKPAAPQLGLSFLNAAGGVATTGGKTTRSMPLSASPSVARPEVDPSTLSESELELRRHMQAMDLEERQQEFIKGSAYVTELGEAFTLNRLMRRDMLELHRIIVEHSQRAFQDIDQVKSTVHELLSMQKAVLEHAASAIARPPPPPPDYVGLGHSALAVVKDLGAALITRSLGRELASRSHALEGDAKAQLSDGSRARDAEISPAVSAEKFSAEKSGADKSGADKSGADKSGADKSGADKSGAEKSSASASIAAVPRDALAQMVTKLHGLSDAELAMAMSSVEGWKGLLDSLRSDGSKVSATAAVSAKSAGEPMPATKS